MKNLTLALLLSTALMVSAVQLRSKSVLQNKLTVKQSEKDLEEAYQAGLNDGYYYGLQDGSQYLKVDADVRLVDDEKREKNDKDNDDDEKYPFGLGKPSEETESGLFWDVEDGYYYFSYDDDSLYFVDRDGNWELIQDKAEEGEKEKEPDDCNDYACFWYEEDGLYTAYHDGSYSYEGYDGTYVYGGVDGTYQNWQPDGTFEAWYPDGSYYSYYPDGSYRERYPDGVEVYGNYENDELSVWDPNNGSTYYRKEHEEWYYDQDGGVTYTNNETGEGYYQDPNGNFNYFDENEDSESGSGDGYDQE